MQIEHGQTSKEPACKVMVSPFYFLVFLICLLSLIHNILSDTKDFKLYFLGLLNRS
jgi:hypothetical protein